MSSPSERIASLLQQIYPPDVARATYERLMSRLGEPAPALPSDEPLFSERDVTLITYADTLRQPGEPPLQTLRRFLNDWLKPFISTVHLLPFYPYSSDDGFSVLNYYEVDPALGSWADVAVLGRDFRLMFDAVINHMSAQSDWFRAFLAGEPGFESMFVTASPDADLSTVTRPRTTPLLTPFTKADGSVVHVWTTFSADQVDLNYRDPETLLRVLDVLLFYVRQGAQVIRLDAIAFLWKEIGTTSLHRPQVHAIIQLIRAVLDYAAPRVLLITETNVPHAENVTYFGDGRNESQLVYNFALPPLLLHTLLSGDARKLSDWINTLTTPSDRTAFFNFTASHDGIGVRPVEGILSQAEVARLLEHTEARGGRISYRDNPDGTRSPYELNITYIDALSLPTDSVETHIRRFMVSQAIMLALAGVPAIYIHSLLGTRNDIEGVRETGHNRRINRSKLDASEVELALRHAPNFRANVFTRYAHLVKTRISSRAFHPNGNQQASTRHGGAVLSLERTAPDGSERVLALFNVTGEARIVPLDGTIAEDLLTGQRTDADGIRLEPYQVVWLRL